MIIIIMAILVVLAIWVCSLQRLHTVWERTLNYTQVSLKIKIINHNYKKKQSVVPDCLISFVFVCREAMLMVGTGLRPGWVLF